MRNEYDFSRGKRGAVIPATGKTRITIYLDDDILDSFRQQAEARGLGYQTLINEVLKTHLKELADSAELTLRERPLTENDLRRVLREELIQTLRA